MFPICIVFYCIYCLFVGHSCCIMSFNVFVIIWADRSKPSYCLRTFFTLFPAMKASFSSTTVLKIFYQLLCSLKIREGCRRGKLDWCCRYLELCFLISDYYQGHGHSGQGNISFLYPLAFPPM